MESYSIKYCSIQYLRGLHGTVLTVYSYIYSYIFTCLLGAVPATVRTTYGLSFSLVSWRCSEDSGRIAYEYGGVRSCYYTVFETSPSFHQTDSASINRSWIKFKIFDLDVNNAGLKDLYVATSGPARKKFWSSGHPCINAPD